MANGHSRGWAVAAVVLVGAVAIAALLASMAVLHSTSRAAYRLEIAQTRLARTVSMPESVAEQVRQAQAPPARTGVVVTAPQVQSTADQTRKELMALLRQRPPSLRRVLKLDPTLLTSQSYLAAYPEVAAFLAAHPEVARDPAYFFENVYTGDSEPYRPDPKLEAIRFWYNLIGGIGAILIIISLMAGVIWLVKVLVEHRGSYQQWRMQTDIHNKLLDRFSSNEELLAYVQSPAGLRFLESTPMATHVSRDVNVPLRRVLWAVQAGLVLLAAGIGLIVVNGHVIEEMQQPLFALGAVIAFLGGGFLASGGASYALSRRLGLLKTN